MENIDKIITHFGNSGPIILFIIGSYLLWNKSTLNFYYQVGFFISSILNVILNS